MSFLSSTGSFLLIDGVLGHQSRSSGPRPVKGLPAPCTPHCWQRLPSGEDFCLPVRPCVQWFDWDGVPVFPYQKFVGPQQRLIANHAKTGIRPTAPRFPKAASPTCFSEASLNTAEPEVQWSWFPRAQTPSEASPSSSISEKTHSSPAPGPRIYHYSFFQKLFWIQSQMPKELYSLPCAWHLSPACTQEHWRLWAKAPNPLVCPQMETEKPFLILQTPGMTLLSAACWCCPPTLSWSSFLPSTGSQTERLLLPSPTEPT